MTKVKTIVIKSNYVDLESLTTDTTYQSGRIWFISNSLKFSIDTVTAFFSPVLPTFVKDADVTYPAYSTYLPTNPGEYVFTTTGATEVQFYFEEVVTEGWYFSGVQYDFPQPFVTNGEHIRVKNREDTKQYSTFFKEYFPNDASYKKYHKALEVRIPALGAINITISGEFIHSSRTNRAVFRYYHSPSDTWLDFERSITFPYQPIIGDSSNLRMYNPASDWADYVVLFRAVYQNIT